MRPRPLLWSAGNARAAALFGATVILPCTMLVVLGLRSAQQDGELAEKRQTEDAERQIALVRHGIVQRLEGIRLRAAAAHAAPGSSSAPFDGDIVFAAAVQEQRLSMPWENDPAAEVASRVLAAEPFAAFLRAGGRREFVDRDATAAAALYERAERIAEHDVQRAYARLMRARALAAAAPREVSSLYGPLVDTALGLTDEHGVPIAYYAAQRLAAARAIDSERLSRLITQALDRTPWLPPADAYLLNQLAQELLEVTPEQQRGEATAVLERVAERLERTEQALAVQRDLGIFRAVQSRGDRGGRWMAYANGRWLITIVQGADPRRGLLIAADATRVIGQASTFAPATGRVSLVPADSPSGVAIDDVPGLRIALDAAPTIASGGVPFTLYAVGVAAALGFALFGGYLLWRDTQRERRLAALRAQFVANVSHELKTPLTAIRMFAETLSIDGGRDAATRSEYLDTIVTESERLSRLIDTVLDFSKIEQQRATYHRRWTRLSDVVRAAGDTLRHSFAHQGFTLTMEIDEQLPPVDIDADAIKQAVINLLSNAQKYSGSSRRVDLRLTRDGDAAVIAVADHGIGIPAHERQRIFEKFYRVPTPENHAIPGTGLGLSVVQHVVDDHHGRIIVDSTPGRGSTFSIRLPLAGTDAVRAVLPHGHVVTPS